MPASLVYLYMKSLHLLSTNWHLREDWISIFFVIFFHDFFPFFISLSLYYLIYYIYYVTFIYYFTMRLSMRMNHELMALHSLLTLISSSICEDKFKRFTLMYEKFFWIVSNLCIEDRRWKMGLFYGWYESTNTASGLHIRQRKELEQWTSNLHSIKKSVWVIPSKNQCESFDQKISLSHSIKKSVWLLLWFLIPSKLKPWVYSDLQNIFYILYS